MVPRDESSPRISDSADDPATTPLNAERGQSSKTPSVGSTESPSRFREKLPGYSRDISRREAADASARAKYVGQLLDESITVPGIGYKIGLDPLLGVVPVSGDLVALAAGLYVVFEAYRVGLPLRTLAAMLVLLGVDFLVGSIPVVGTVIDAVLKVNKHNAAMIESYVEGTEQ